MKEIKLPDLPVRSTWYDGYHAKVAFSKITVESVNYKILKAINEHPSYTRDQINTEVDGIEGKTKGDGDQYGKQNTHPTHPQSLLHVIGRTTDERVLATDFV